MTKSEIPPRETSLLAQPLKTLVRAFKETPEADLKNGTDATLSLDETLDLLGHGRRRAIVDQFGATDQRHIPVADLAEEIACAEYGCPPSELTGDQRKRVYIALVQSHLPRLDAADVVTYRSEAKVVTRGQHFDYLCHVCTALRDAVS